MHEEDTCRICSAPAEPDQPLFHPCKCSGTIRYIHQDCLTTWLAHSNKKSCDVCKYKYSFTKIYSPNMPEQLPVILFLRRLAQQVFWSFVLGLRFLMVGTIWLAFLPYVTVWTWRFYFFMGDHIAWWINDRPRPETASAFTPFFYGNISRPTQANTTSSGNTTVEFSESYPAWRVLSSDIFTGQIIASLIVLAFLGVFLLREWIVQNARPGVFEDNEVPNEEPHPEVQQIHEAQPDPDHEPPNGPVVAPALDAPDEFRNAHGPISGVLQPNLPLAPLPQVNGLETIAEDPDRLNSLRMNDPPTEMPHTTKGKMREPMDLNGWPDSDRELLDLDLPRSRKRVHTVQGRIRDRDRSPYRGGSTRRQSSNLLAEAASSARGRAREASRRSRVPQQDDSGLASTPFSGALGEANNDFEFTFQIGSSPSSSSSLLSIAGTSSTQSSPGPFSFDPPPESEKLFEYKPATLPYTIMPGHPSSSESIPSPYPSTSSFSSSPPLPPRRPPLPASASPLIPDRPPHAVDPPLTSRASSSRTIAPRNIITDVTPLPSPSLATYRAPEELEVGGAGPSKRKGYFDDEQQPDDAQPRKKVSTDLDPDHYFRDVRDDEDEEEEEDDEDDGGDVQPLMLDSEEEEEWDEFMERLEDGVPEVRPEALGIPREGVEREQAAEQPGPPLDPNEDPDGNLDDDMDGALEEAIGMRGHVTTVFQNAALMIFALDTSIGLVIWLPFTIGKTAALLSLEPYRILHLLHFPIRAMRVVTDPGVDSFFFLVQKVLYPTVLNMFRSLRKFPLFHTQSEYQKGRGFEIISKSTEVISVQWDKLANMWSSIPVSDSHQPGLFARVLPVADSLFVRFGEPHFAILGKQVRLRSLALKDTWVELVNGDDASNRIFAVVLGYAVVGMLIALYLNILNVGSVQSAGRAVRSAIRQQLIVVKVAAFIVIELIIFPLGCGVMLDLCTHHLFPETSVRSRTAFFMYAPVTSVFYHWMIGTMFMYLFAILLAGCRKIMRPGAMWFIKDPQDQNNHPIRDILDRPTVMQLRKLAVSAVMYSIVVAGGVGSIVTFFRLWGTTLMPLRWTMREPLSEIPIDLLFLHLVLPPTLQYLRPRPRKIVHYLTAHYWRWAAHQLRLTSYMFGGRHASEEHVSPNWSWSSFFKKISSAQIQDEETKFEGSLRRVPAGDNIPLPKDLRATVAVDQNGEALDDAGRAIIEAQNAETEAARRTVKDDYTIVYIPPNFRQRIILFIIALWLVGSMICVAALAVPIHLGRSIFAMVLSREVHDGYSFVVGFYMLWACFIIGKTVDRLDKRRQRNGADEPRATWPLFLAKRTLLWLPKVLWMFFWLGIVIPTLIAIVMEVYLVLPLRLMLAPDVTLKIHVVESWALGLLYTKLAMTTMRFRPQNRFDDALTQIKQNGWRRPDAVAATIEVIAPVTGGLLAMIFLPPIVVTGIQWLLGVTAPTKLLFAYVYPGIFAAAACARAGAALVDVCASWAQSIRDSEFLVEMRLRNLEPSRTPSVERPTESPVI